MKNNHYPLAILFTFIGLLPFILSSCTKNNSPKPKTDDKTIKVTIQHTGDLQYYKGLLTVTGTLDDDQKKVSVSGVNWDEEISSGEVTIYSKDFEPVINEVVFETDRPASGIQFGYSAWVHDHTVAVDFVPITTTIKYYVNDELVKTDSYKAGFETTVEPYMGKLDAKDY